MLKRFAVVAVLALFAGNAAFGTDAASANKEFKTTTKEALAALKTSISTALATYSGTVKTLAAGVKAGTTTTTAATELEVALSVAVQAIYSAVETANAAVDTNGSADMDTADDSATDNGPNTLLNFMEGDGGTLDKYNVAVKKLVDKAVSTLAKGAASVVKAAAKSTAITLTARVNPIRLPASASPNGAEAASVVGTVVPLQITHLVGINTNPSVAGNCQIRAGGLSNGNISFVLLDAAFGTADNADNVALVSGDRFLVASVNTLNAQNFQLQVGEGATLTVGSQQDAIGAR